MSRSGRRSCPRFARLSRAFAGPLLAAALSFVAWQPFVRPDFDLWQADDGEYHLLRVYVFEHAFRGGAWLPRWIPDLFVGFGYPIFNYYAPGTYYLALALRALGLDVYTTVQALGALAASAGAAGAYCFARSVFSGRLPGVIAAAVYAYAPYPFIVNLLIRADLAEALGLALLPWVLLAAWRAGRSPGQSSVAALSAAMGAIILTHNLTALMTLPAALVTGLFAALRHGVRPGAGAVAGGLALALALTIFFWLPALVEQRYVHIDIAVHGESKSVHTWLVDPLAGDVARNLGDPQTPAGPLDLHLSYPYNLNYPQKPSLGQGVLFFAAAIAVPAGLARRRPHAPEAAFFLGGTLILWFATTTWSAWLWDHVPLMRFLQFAWRLNGPLALALALATAGATAMAARRAATGSGHVRPVAQAIMALLTLFLVLNTTTARPLWRADSVERRVGGPQLVGTENTLFGAGTTTGGEFVPRAVEMTSGPGQRRGNGTYERLYPEFGWVAGRVRPLEGDLRITGLWSGVTWTEALVEAATSGTIAFRTIAFPGWRAYLDGHEVTSGLAPRDPVTGIAPGFLTVAVPAGAHRVQIAFGPTPLRTLAAALSILALAAMGWWLAGGARPQALHFPSSPRLGQLLALTPAALLALACAHDALRPAMGPPAATRPEQTRLVADVAELARRGQATVSSPGGASLGPFVDVRRLALGDYGRSWLYMHPPSAVSVTLDLPERAAFQAGLALDPRTWHADGADGVRFILEVTSPGGAPQRIFEEHVNPRAHEEQRRWLDRWIDLSAFGGRRITLTLRTEPAQTVEFDWAGWADPIIVTQRDARRPGGGAPGPLPTPRSS